MLVYFCFLWVKELGRILDDIFICGEMRKLICLLV